MNMAIALPRATGSWYTSAQIPPTTEMAHDPPTPTNNRKITSAAKFGDTEDAIEKMEKTANEAIITHFRPYDSLSGPQIMGPQT